jgi:hypothetical protein
MTRFFLLMRYFTSGFTARSITAALQLRKGIVPPIVATCLRPVAGAFESTFPGNIADVVCRDVFPDFPHVFAIVDAPRSSLIGHLNAKSTTTRGSICALFLEVQALITPDGQCVHLSRVYCGATHDKAIFDCSEM